MNKLDYKFRFRDSRKFKIFVNILTVLMFAYFIFLIELVIIKDKDYTRPFVFGLLPALMLLSFFRKNDYLFIVAEFITIIADVFLILLKKIDIGFPIYLFVQLTYALYFFYRDNNKKRAIAVTIVRGVLMIASIVALFLLKKLNIRLSFGALYFINILINVVCAIILKDPILIVGFILFMISDTFIALGMFINQSSSFYKVLSSFNFVYFFYIISQVILIFNKHNNVYNPITRK